MRVPFAIRSSSRSSMRSVRGGLPVGLKRRGLLEGLADLRLEDRTRDRFLEWLRRPDLVAVVDALDRLLSADPVFEGEGPRRFDARRRWLGRHRGRRPDTHSPAQDRTQLHRPPPGTGSVDTLI